MNKLLIAITLIGFPALSFAEIYFCTPEEESTILDLTLSGRGLVSSSGGTDGRIVVDTSRGFRPNASWSDYVGQCESTSDSSLSCNFAYGAGFWHIFITETSRRDSFFVLSHTTPALVVGQGGTCTRA